MANLETKSVTNKNLFYFINFVVLRSSVTACHTLSLGAELKQLKPLFVAIASVTFASSCLFICFHSNIFSSSHLHTLITHGTHTCIHGFHNIVVVVSNDNKKTLQLPKLQIVLHFPLLVLHTFASTSFHISRRLRFPQQIQFCALFGLRGRLRMGLGTVAPPLPRGRGTGASPPHSQGISLFCQVQMLL